MLAGDGIDLPCGRGLGLNPSRVSSFCERTVVRYHSKIIPYISLEQYLRLAMYRKFMRLLRKGKFKRLRREFVDYAKEQGKNYGDDGYDHAVKTLHKVAHDIENPPPINHPFKEYTDRAKKWRS